MTVLLLSVAVAIVAGVWVSYPLFFKRWVVIDDRVTNEVFEGESRKRVALAALKDVEYDHAAGKLDDEDYRGIRGVLEREALEALQLSVGLPVESVEQQNVHTCGFRNPIGSRFCAGCGHRLA